MAEFDYDSLNPNIREVVRWLHSRGFETADSGDGQTRNFECDRDYPYVVIPVDLAAGGGSAELVWKTDNLVRLLQSDHRITVEPFGPDDTVVIGVQAFYLPAIGYAFIELTGLTDDMLRKEKN
jgi:hypothetical protein